MWASCRDKRRFLPGDDNLCIFLYMAPFKIEFYILWTQKKRLLEVLIIEWLRKVFGYLIINRINNPFRARTLPLANSERNSYFIFFISAICGEDNRAISLLFCHLSFRIPWRGGSVASVPFISLCFFQVRSITSFLMSSIKNWATIKEALLTNSLLTRFSKKQFKYCKLTRVFFVT